MLWQDVLLFQFHDVLPGSCIKAVYDTTAQRYGTAARDAGGSMQFSKVLFRKETCTAPRPFVAVTARLAARRMHTSYHIPATVAPYAPGPY